MQSVVHVMPFYDVPERAAFSGAEIHLFTLMLGQIAAGMQVELVMAIGWPGPRLEAKAAELSAAGVRVTMVPFGEPGLGWRSRFSRLRALSLLKAHFIACQKKILHLHIITPSSWLFAWAAWRARHKAVVASYHNNEPYLAKVPARWALCLIDRVTRRTIAISQSVRQHLVMNVGLSPSRTRVVYYGIEVPPVPDKAALRVRMGLPAEGFIVGFVGRLIEQKDVPTLLRAFARLPDVVGVVIGGGPLEAQLKAEAQKLGLSHVHFIGPRLDGPELIGGLDALVLCSVFEGLGLGMLEAMVRRVAIVGTRAGSIPEVLANGEAGRLVDVGDDAALAAALQALKDDENDRATLTAAALARAEAVFTVPAMVRNTAAVYAEALGE